MWCIHGIVIAGACKFYLIHQGLVSMAVMSVVNLSAQILPDLGLWISKKVVMDFT